MAKRIRIGNDVQVTWTLVDQSGEPYDLSGRSFVIELDVAWTRIRFSGSELSVEGNVVSFTYPGKEQKQPGPYHLKLVENEGDDEMVTYDVKDAFVLVPHSWMEGGENAPSLSTEYVDISSVIGTKGDKGDKGEPGEDGKDGKDGIDGKTPVITADAAGNIYVDGRLLTGIIASKTSELADSKYFQLDSSGNLTTKSGIRNLYVPGWVSSLGESPTSVGVCDGFFRTVAALRAAFPSPTVGEFAYVGTSLPAAIYVCETEGAWTDSGATFSGGAVDAVEVVDDVTSGGTTKALSAEQGVNLKALMDEGYQFRGIATTAMESYEPDQKCFYIALEPGTYFDSLILDDGEIALLMWDAYWHKETTGAVMREELEDFLSQFAVLKGDVQEMMDNYPNITFEGDVTNAPDEEDLTMTEGDVIKFKDRPSVYGKGYVILRRNKTFAEQVTAADTIYEIRYGFDLNGGSVTVPSGCRLLFNGGKLSNGTLVGTDTEAELTVVCFSGMTIDGTWRIPYIDARAFEDIEEENVLQQAVNLCKGGNTSTLYVDSSLTCLVSVARDDGAALVLPSDIEMLLNGTVQLVANSYPRYKILFIRGKNVVVRGSGKIWGDFTKGHEFAGTTTHEWGRGITIWGGENVIVDGIECGYCTGDAFNISKYSESNPVPAKDVVLRNIYGHTSRRQGLTVANCDGLLVQNYVFDNINGTNPQAGIDVEPNTGDANRLVFVNGKISNCKIGVSIVRPMTGGKYQNIDFTNIHFDGISEIGFIVENNSDGAGASCTVRGLSFVNASAIAPLVRVSQGGSMIIDGMIDMGMGDQNDTAYPCCLFYLNHASASVSARNLRVRCGSLAAARHGMLEITNSFITLPGALGSAYDSIGDTSTVKLLNTTFSGEKMLRLKGRVISVENCDITATYILFENVASTRDCLFSLKRNRITLSGSSNGYGIVVSSAGTSFTDVSDNIISHTGTSYLFVPQASGDFISCVNNDITAPNISNGSYFSNSAARWNYVSKGLRKGSTANRPTLFVSRSWITLDEGYCYFDTTLGKPIWWNGTAWVDSTGTTV